MSFILSLVATSFDLACDQVVPDAFSLLKACLN